jgi:hypothetical protein
MSENCHENKQSMTTETTGKRDSEVQELVRPSLSILFSF